MECQIDELRGSENEFSVKPIMISKRTSAVQVGFYSPYPTRIISAQYVLIAQGTKTTELTSCTWLVCQKRDRDILLKRIEAARKSQQADNELKYDWVPEKDALVLEKVAILMTDNARKLLGPKEMVMDEVDVKSLNFSVKKHPVCYFI